MLRITAHHTKGELTDMANYYGHGRTNYFRVKDVQAFTEALPADFEVVSGSDGKVAVLARNESGGWVEYVWADEAGEEDTEVDVVDLIAEHLVDGEVAVAQSVGQEKMRYLAGYAVAVNNTGDRVQISLDDIYQAAAERFGVAWETITTATY